MRRTSTLIAMLAGTATLTLTGTAQACAAGPEYIDAVDAGGVTLLGRARNESCSVTTMFHSNDGQAHTVTVNQSPKWGPPTVQVPAGGQVTIVVNGDLVTPYTVTVDDTITVTRPVPTVTPGGVDCGPTPPATTVVSVTTPAPTTTVPELDTIHEDPLLPPPTTTTTVLEPPTTVTVTVPPETSTTVPYVELSAPPMLPETGKNVAPLAVVGVITGLVGLVLVLTGRKQR